MKRNPTKEARRRAKRARKKTCDVLDAINRLPWRSRLRVAWRIARGRA